MTSKWGIWA